MQELILGPVAIWFGVPALVGTACFTLRMALSLVGGVDTDAGFDYGFGIGQSGRALA